MGSRAEDIGSGLLRRLSWPAIAAAVAWALVVRALVVELLDD
jgi:hypothetical protein